MQETIKTNEVIIKLLALVGCPPWFQAIKLKKNANNSHFIALMVNTKDCLKELESIPEVIDNIPIRVFFENSIKYFYSSKSVPTSLRIVK